VTLLAGQEWLCQADSEGSARRCSAHRTPATGQTQATIIVAPTPIASIFGPALCSVRASAARVRFHSPGRRGLEGCSRQAVEHLEVRDLRHKEQAQALPVPGDHPHLPVGDKDLLDVDPSGRAFGRS
jgi:hypothetical protein